MGKMTLGERIKKARQDKKLTQEELGEMAEITSAYIGQIERGERTPSIKRLRMIAKQLDISEEYLLAENITENMILNLEINNELASMSEEQKRAIINIIRAIKELNE